jgi:hypothetical protein
MEDRITPGLYLETTDQSPADYARERVPQLLALAAVERATWWQNAHLNRSDLPRRIAEFPLLAVYETGAGFSVPAPTPGITGYHFRHYPRPAQGTLSGKPTVGILLVLISPRRPEMAQRLRDWADFVHIRHIAEVATPGYTMITPYENATGGDPRFMHFYEMDTDDPETAFKTMAPRVQAKLGPPGTPAYDAWAFDEALRIVYVNTFRKLGERANS